MILIRITIWCTTSTRPANAISRSPHRKRRREPGRCRLVDEVREALLQEREHQEEVGLTSQYEIEGLHDFIFLNRYGFPQNPQTVNRAIGRIVDAYNDRELERAATERREPFYLPAFSCHNLRHTFCTRLCEVETNLKIIQDIMGHADISTTMKIYAEVTQQAKADRGKRS